MLNTFKVANEFTTVKELRIRILEDEQIGTYTINDAVTIKGLVKIFHMTSNYNSDGDISKINLEKKDFIYTILKDAEEELKQIFPNETINIISSMEDEIKKVREILIS